MLKGSGRARTWHFTSNLTPTHQIKNDLFHLAFNTDRQHVNIVNAALSVAGFSIKNKILIPARPKCVTFISWRFSRADVAAWLSNAEARSPLLDLSFEGYIQAENAIDLSCLQYWMPDAYLNPLGMKLADCEAYKSFCASGDAYEVCSDGTPAVARAGRPRKDKASHIATQCHINAPLPLLSPPLGTSIPVYDRLPCIRQRMHLSLATHPDAAIA
jgi:hypothetical protein